MDGFRRQAIHRLIFIHQTITKMKKLFTIIGCVLSLSASTQNVVDWIGDQYSQTHWALRGTIDGGLNYMEIIVVDTNNMVIKIDTTCIQSLRFPQPGSPLMVLGCDTAGNIFSYEYQEAFVTDTTVFSGLNATVDYVINHGLSFTPSQVHVQPMNQDAAEWCYVHSITATTFTISFVVNPTTGTNNILMGYVAYK